MTKISQTVLLLALTASVYFRPMTGEAQANARTKSKNFISSLSSEDCGRVLHQIASVKAQKTEITQLNLLLDAISFECGIGHDDPTISFKPVLFTFEKSELKILWDGQSIAVNEKAEAIFAFTMNPSQQQRVHVTTDKINPAGISGSSIIDTLTRKLVEIKDHLVTITKDGETYLVMSGYAWHDRGSYTPEQINGLNEKAIGVGVERVIINDNGNREAVGLMLINDSFSKPQLSVSYEWQAGLALGENVKVWGGVSTGLILRANRDYMPFPYVFPTAGLSIGKVNIKTVFIPKMGNSINKGNIVFVFASVPWK